MTKVRYQSAAVVTIRNADKMTKKGRAEVATWLRRHASDLVKYGANYDGNFRGRYRYSARAN